MKGLLHEHCKAFSMERNGSSWVIWAIDAQAKASLMLNPKTGQIMQFKSAGEAGRFIADFLKTPSTATGLPEYEKDLRHIESFLKNSIYKDRLADSMGVE